MEKKRKTNEIITLTCTKKKRKVPRDPSDDYHISNLRETIEAHGPQVHPHAHFQCTTISNKPVTKFLRLKFTGSSKQSLKKLHFKGKR